jgi:hypothetical protein
MSGYEMGRIIHTNSASYNATSSLVRFENKNIFFNLKKRSSLLQPWSQSYDF